MLEFPLSPSQLECRSGSCLAERSVTLTLSLSDSLFSPCPWVSCSLCAVTDLNNSLSQLSLSPRHGGANQLPRHDALKGGGERVRERMPEREGQREGPRRRWGEQGGRGRRGGRPAEPAREKELIWLEDKTLLLFFFCFFCPCCFCVSYFSTECKQTRSPSPRVPFRSGPCLSFHRTSPNSPAVNMSPLPSLP